MHKHWMRHTNHDLKIAVVRPTQAYLQKTNFFFAYRIKAHSQLESQLFPAPQEPKLLDNTAFTKRWDDNIMNMRSLITEHNLFDSQCIRSVVNAFTGKEATTGQAEDLLNARTIGEKHYRNYITHHIMRVPSVTNAPFRKARLLTMAPPKTTKTKLSQKEKEQRDTNKYLRRRLAWCNRTGQQYDEGEEYTLLPRALADADGQPHTGTKSNWTKSLQGRYDEPTHSPIVSTPPWFPQVAIVDAMFSTHYVSIHLLPSMLTFFLTEWSFLTLAVSSPGV